MDKPVFEGLSFFLQGRLKRKHSEVTNDIISNGGKVVKSKSQATYIIASKKDLDNQDVSGHPKIVPEEFLTKEIAKKRKHTIESVITNNNDNNVSSHKCNLEDFKEDLAKLYHMPICDWDSLPQKLLEEVKDRTCLVPLCEHQLLLSMVQKYQDQKKQKFLAKLQLGPKVQTGATADDLVPFIKNLAGKKPCEWKEDDIIQCAIGIRGITSIDMRKSSADAASMWSSFCIDWSALVRSREELREIVDPCYVFFDFQAAAPGGLATALGALPAGLGQAGLNGATMAYSVGGAVPILQYGNAKQLGGNVQGALGVNNCHFWVCDAVNPPEYW